MESQPQNPKLRNNPNNFHLCTKGAGPICCIYSKTCLKRPLEKKTKNWFSRPIFA